MARSFPAAGYIRTACTATQRCGFPTWAAIVRRNSQTGWNGVVGQYGGTTNLMTMEFNATSGITYGSGSAYVQSGTGVLPTTTDDWCLVVAGKATGTSIVYFWKYVFDPGVWTTYNSGASTLADQSVGTADTFIFGQWEATDQYDGDIAAVAQWNRLLTDAEVRSLIVDLSAWVSTGPSGLWLFDQASVAMPVTDLTGNGGNQSAISGTAVSSRSVPWGYGTPLITIERTSAAPGITPDLSAYPGLVQWLEAGSIVGNDGDVIQTWTDLSSAAHNMTQATSGLRPVLRKAANGLGSRPALEFNGSKQIASTGYLTSAYNQSVTVYVVFKRTVGTGTSFVFDVNNNAFSMGLAGDTVAANAWINAGWPSAFEYIKSYSGINPAMDQTVVMSEATVACFRFNGSNFRISANGNENAEWTMGDAAVGSQSLAGQGFTLGAHANGSYAFTGLIAEFAVFNAVHTDVQRKAIELALRQKYGIVLPTIAYVDGDSLTSGTGASDGAHNWPSQLLGLRSFPFHVFNYGVAGSAYADLASREPTYIDPFVTTDRTCFYIPWFGTNDINNGASAATVEGYLQTMWSARRAFGFKVLALTIVPRSEFYGTGKETIRVAVNTWIRANWSSYSDGLADIAANAHFASPTAYSDTTYYNADGTHLNDTGYGVVASVVSIAITGGPAPVDLAGSEPYEDGVLAALLTGQLAHVIALVANPGGWTDELGNTDAASLIAALQNADGHYLQSPVRPASSSITFQLTPLTAPVGGTRTIGGAFVRDVGDGTIDITVNLRNHGSGTLVQAFSLTNVATVESETDLTETADPTSWALLDIELVANQP